MALQSPTACARETLNVLLISKDDETVHLWKTLFEQRKYRVIRESLPENGVQTSRLFSPALIVLDIDQPAAYSLDLCRQLRATTQGTLLLLNSNHNRIDLSEYYRAGVDEVIPASLSPMALLIKSLAWLARHEWIGPNRQSMEMHGNLTG